MKLHGLRGCRPGLRMAVWSVGADLDRGRPIGCTPALSVTQKAPLQLRYAACGAIQVLYAFAFHVRIPPARLNTRRHAQQKWWH